MENWREPESILAPLIVSLRLGDDVIAGCANALIAATSCIPEATRIYNMKKPGKFRRHTEVRRRAVMTGTDERATPYLVPSHLLAIPVVSQLGRPYRRENGEGPVVDRSPVKGACAQDHESLLVASVRPFRRAHPTPGVTRCSLFRGSALDL